MLAAIKKKQKKQKQKKHARITLTFLVICWISITESSKMKMLKSFVFIVFSQF